MAARSRPSRRRARVRRLIRRDKTMVVDGVWATIGSTNFDPRSFELNEGINVTVFDRGLAEQLENVFRRDLQRSEEMSYAKWQSRGLRQRVLELFALPARSQL